MEAEAETLRSIQTDAMTDGGGKIRNGQIGETHSTHVDE
jgi:hypothetical protein